ncbi:MAG: hypothetical protein NTY98_19710 [Verrucomicrobia bacterium]|nr:hypothetical protein [Verrucomicrobiota bacterium]
MPDDVSNSSQPAACEAAAHSKADGEDLIVAALADLRGSLSADGGSHGPPSLARQKKDLREWAGSLGLLLSSSDLPAQVVRGGMEHDCFREGERIFTLSSLFAPFPLRHALRNNASATFPLLTMIKRFRTDPMRLTTTPKYVSQ